MPTDETRTDWAKRCLRQGFVAQRGLDLVVRASAGPTCITPLAETTLDFFVVSGLLADSACGPEVLLGYPVAPHRPVRLLLSMVQAATATKVYDIKTPRI